MTSTIHPTAQIKPENAIIYNSYPCITSCRDSNPTGIDETTPAPINRLKILKAVGRTQQKTWLNSLAMTTPFKVFWNFFNMWAVIKYART
jgi:hypothetical protein